MTTLDEAVARLFGPVLPEPEGWEILADRVVANAALAVGDDTARELRDLSRSHGNPTPPHDADKDVEPDDGAERLAFTQSIARAKAVRASNRRARKRALSLVGAAIALTAAFAALSTWLAVG